jgi:hypothetical protein
MRRICDLRRLGLHDGSVAGVIIDFVRRIPAARYESLHSVFRISVGCVVIEPRVVLSTWVWSVHSVVP